MRVYPGSIGLIKAGFTWMIRAVGFNGTVAITLADESRKKILGRLDDGKVFVDM